MPSTQPQSVLPRSLGLVLRGATRYPRERLNTTITLENGQCFRVFREVIIRDNPPQATGGVFRVWFYAVTSLRQTIWMSHATKFLIFGMPGFRGKMWMLNDQTGEFGGIYQFTTVENARDYAHSFAMALSKRRARPGMFSVEYYAKDGEASLFRAPEQPIVPPRSVHQAQLIKSSR